MDHQDFLVTVYNDQGEPISSKKRRDINKQQDIIECVEVMVITSNDEVVLSLILNNQDNVYPGKFGAAVATIRREQESELEAAKRALKDEMFIEEAVPIFLGRSFFRGDLNLKKWLTVFVLQTDVDITKFNVNRTGRLVVKSFAEIKEKMESPNDLAGTFKEIWNLYYDQLLISK